MVDHLVSPELDQIEFDRIRKFVHRMCGINLSLGKEELVKARLIKRLGTLKMTNFEQYLECLERDKSGEEIILMIDALTTNKTSFFREPEHFEFLRREVVRAKHMQRLRLWSAGCSSGEEPYSIAISLMEEIPDARLGDIRILATDVSTRMIDTAREAIYNGDILKDVSPRLLRKYFTCVKSESPCSYRVHDSIRNVVHLARLNLIDQWPMEGPFNAIFCRNVMIYFDKDTRRRLISRFLELLESGGYLFVGHSESLVSTTCGLRYVQPAVYVKE